LLLDLLSTGLGQIVTMPHQAAQTTDIIARTLQRGFMTWHVELLWSFEL
jgi:hypothetical protein